MSWVKHTDQRSINRKMRRLSDAAYRLDDEAIQWASRNMTDGRIPAEDFDDIGRHPTVKAAAELVDRGRWHTADQGWCGSRYCAPPGKDGWVIHDYLEYNPSREKAIAEREANAEKQRAFRARRDASRNPGDNPSRDASRNPERIGGGNPGRDPGSNGTPSRPVPSRPQTGREDPPSLSVTPPAATRRAGADGEDRKPRNAAVRAAAIADAQAAAAAGRRAARRAPPAAGAYDRLVEITTLPPDVVAVVPYPPDMVRAAASPHDDRDGPAGIVAQPWHPGQATTPHPNGATTMGEPTAADATDATPDPDGEPFTADDGAAAEANAAGEAAEASQDGPGDDEPEGGGSMGDSGDHTDADDTPATDTVPAALVDTDGGL